MRILATMLALAAIPSGVFMPVMPHNGPTPPRRRRKRSLDIVGGYPGAKVQRATIQGRIEIR